LIITPPASVTRPTECPSSSGIRTGRWRSDRRLRRGVQRGRPRSRRSHDHVRIHDVPDPGVGGLSRTPCLVDHRRSRAGNSHVDRRHGHRRQLDELVARSDGWPGLRHVRQRQQSCRSAPRDCWCCRTWPASVRQSSIPTHVGLVAGLTLRHNRAHLFRAAYEGIAFGIRPSSIFLRSQRRM
jgi:hypothetical protein